jgi:hypothetical protein
MVLSQMLAHSVMMGRSHRQIHSYTLVHLAYLGSLACHDTIGLRGSVAGYGTRVSLVSLVIYGALPSWGSLIGTFGLSDSRIRFGTVKPPRFSPRYGYDPEP